MSKLFKRSLQRDKSKFCREGENFRNEIQEMLDYGNTGKTTVHLYQNEALLEVYKMIENDPPNKTKPCLIEAPTGSGKSGMIVMLPYVLESKKALVLTPSAIMSNQLAEAFGSRQDKKNCFFKEAKFTENNEELSSFLEDVTVIRHSTDAVEKSMTNLVIVNAQKFGGKSKATLSMKYRDEDTIENVETFFAMFDTLIVDEAHHYPANTWKQIVDEFRKPSDTFRKKIVFLTATPYTFDSRLGRKVHILRNDDRTAFTIDREICIGLSIRDIKFDMNYGNPNHYAQHILDILREQKKTENRFEHQVMILASGRDEVARIVEELNDFFQRRLAVGISGTTKHIAEGLKDFTDGKYRIAVTCKVGLEGYDNTNVSICVIVRKIVTGKIMFSQFVGRCMRSNRGLPKINGKAVPDRTVGRVISYKMFGQEKLRKEYEEMDEVIADEDPSSEDEEDD